MLLFRQYLRLLHTSFRIRKLSYALSLKQIDLDGKCISVFELIFFSFSDVMHDLEQSTTSFFFFFGCGGFTFLMIARLNCSFVITLTCSTTFSLLYNLLEASFQFTTNRLLKPFALAKENKCSMFSLRQLFEDKKCIKYKFVDELLTQWLESFSNDITLMKREYTDIELIRCLKYKTTNHCIFYFILFFLLN